MARQVFFDGPEPPEGQQWCAICVMLVKQAVIEAEHTMIDVSKRGDESDPPMRIDIARHVKLGGHELAAAVTRAISTVVPQWGPMDVCWSHALGLQLMPGGVMPASPQEAAMLSQAAQLGNQNRRQG
jgi:hypothetical protein